jgi:hypothetical protein
MRLQELMVEVACVYVGPTHISFGGFHHIYCGEGEVQRYIFYFEKLL